MAAAQMQLDHVNTDGRDTGHYGANSAYAYHIENDDDPERESRSLQGEGAAYQLDEDYEALAAGYDVFGGAIEDLDVEHASPEERDVFAAEPQNSCAAVPKSRAWRDRIIFCRVLVAFTRRVKRSFAGAFYGPWRARGLC